MRVEMEDFRNFCASTGGEEYIYYVWRALEGNKEVLDPMEMAKFRNSFPHDYRLIKDLSEFLGRRSCINIEEHELKFLCAFTYYYIQDYHEEYDYFEEAINFYLLLCSKIIVMDLFVDKHCHKLLQIVGEKLDDKYGIAAPNEDIIINIGELFESKAFDLVQCSSLVLYMCKICTIEKNVIVKHFDRHVLDDDQKTPGTYAFCGLMNIFKYQILNERGERGVIPLMFNTLLGIDYNETYVVYRMNLRNFLNYVLILPKSKPWLVRYLIYYAQTSCDNKFLKEIIKSLSEECIESLLINFIVALKTDSYIHIENIAGYIIFGVEEQFSSLPQNRKEHLMINMYRQLMFLMRDANCLGITKLLNIYVRLSDSTCIEAHSAEKSILCTPDLKYFIQRLVKHVDYTWTDKSYNISFLNFTWRMYCKCYRYFYRPHIQIMEKLISTASARDLERCGALLTKIVANLYNMEHEKALALFMLKKIAHFIVEDPSTSSSKYIRALNLITFDKLIEDQSAERDKAFKIVTYLMSANVNYSVLLKRLTASKSITPKLIDQMMKLDVFLRPGALTVVTMFTEAINYCQDMHPRICQILSMNIENLVKHDELKNLFMYLHIVYKQNPGLLQHPYTESVKMVLRRTIEDMNKDFLTLQYAFTLTKEVYQKNLTEIEFVVNLFALIVPEMIEILRSRNLDLLVFNCSKLATLNYMTLFANFYIYKELVELVSALVKEKVDEVNMRPEAVTVWVVLIQFYTTLTIKKKIPSAEARVVLFAYLKNGHKDLKLYAYDALYEICSLNNQTEYYCCYVFEALSTETNQYIKYKGFDSIVKHLLNTDFTLKYQYLFLLFKNLLEMQDVNFEYFKNVIEKEFVIKFEQAICSKIVQIIYHINMMRDYFVRNEVENALPANIILQPYSPRKKLNIYKILMSKFSRYICFNIMREISEDIINPILKGTVDPATGSDVLYDGVAIIIITIVKDVRVFTKPDEVNELIGETMSFVKNDLHLSFLEEVEYEVLPIYHTYIRDVITMLLKLLSKIDQINPTLGANVFLAVLLMTNVYKITVRGLVSQDTSGLLKRLFGDIPEYYESHKNQINFGVVGINWNFWKF